MCHKGFTKIVLDGLQIMRVISDILSRQYGISNCNEQNICTFFSAVPQAQKEKEESHKDGKGRTAFTVL